MNYSITPFRNRRTGKTIYLLRWPKMLGENVIVIGRTPLETFLNTNLRPGLYVHLIPNDRGL